MKIIGISILKTFAVIVLGVLLVVVFTSISPQEQDFNTYSLLICNDKDKKTTELGRYHSKTNIFYPERPYIQIYLLSNKDCRVEVYKEPIEPN